ncbi:MAG: NAD-dependent epimerase/dehydratase family protein [Kiritimatiellae bacterium]|nr:NAD-dependent epimerase/dehydratase family protein [Kiritimatiellia bacterium]
MIRSVLLVGGTGFIGRNLTMRLLTEGFQVRCFDRVKPQWLPPSVEFLEGDFTATHLLEPALLGADAVVHLASTTLPQTSNNDPQFDIASNLLGTIGLLNLAIKHRTKRLLFLSSGGTVYGHPAVLPVTEHHATHPMCSYGIVKLAIEKYLRMYHQLHGLSTCSLRLANPYGEHQRVDGIQGAVTIFTHKALNNEVIEVWGDGTATRDYVYIGDVIDAVYKALLSDRAGLEINIGSGSGTTLNDLISMVERTLNRKVRVEYRKARDFDVAAIWLDIALARQVLGWAPKTPISNGIAILAEAMQHTQPSLWKSQ